MANQHRNPQNSADLKYMQFAAMVVDGVKPAEAAYRIYDVKKSNAASKGYQLMRHKRVQYFMKKGLEMKGLTPSYVLNKLKNIVEKSDNERNVLKALEMLGKHLHLFDAPKNNQLNQNNLNVKQLNISHEQANRILGVATEVVEEGE